jgi:cation diffusion facilitator family transporter
MKALEILSYRRSATALRRAREGQSVRTILVAFLANLVIAIAKLIAGIVSRSTGLLAEAAHSAADSVNEIFLAIGLHRERQPPDATHPFGHGRERFLWAFMASIASFLIGGCVSVGLAVVHLAGSHPVAGGPWAWIVLAVSFAADGISWIQGLRQTRRQAKEYEVSVWRYLVYASDPVVRAVLVEDSAALIGLGIATAGLVLSTLLGSGVPDAVASLLIGVLLAATAVAVARPLADFLAGRSIPPRQFEKLQAIFREDPAVERVLDLRAVYSAPEEVIVVAKVRPSPRLSIEELGRAMDDLDRRIRRELPTVADVFVDVTASRGRRESRQRGR